MKYLKKLDIKLVRGQYKNPVKGQVREPQQIYDVFKAIKDEAQETLIAVFLDKDLLVKSYDILSIGSQSATAIVPPELFGRTYILKAAQFILVHNHPSGDPDPSPEDIEVIQLLTKQSKIMNLSFLDFIIVGDNRYWSMFEALDGGSYKLGSVV